MTEKSETFLSGGPLPVPPPRLRRGASDFEKEGKSYAEHLVRIGCLNASGSVLDVGCGAGRMASALFGLLDVNARYEGFDLNREQIDWCSEHITTRAPNFRFQCVPVRNGRYHPDGVLAACEFRFPYDTATFDLVFLTSVFTHMLPHDMEHYLGEIARVLIPEGKLFCTVFLMDGEARRAVKDGTAVRRFEPSGSNLWATHPDKPEGALAYDENYFIECCKKSGLSVLSVEKGGWRKNWDERFHQDHVLAQKCAEVTRFG